MFSIVEPFGGAFTAPVAGTGGGAAAFAPTDIAGLKRWYAVRRETAYANTDPITSLTDWSGNSATMTAAGANCPTYTTNVQNSLPSGKGDGNNVMTATGVNLGTAHTIFAVLKPVNDSVMISGSGGAAQNYMPYIEAATVYYNESTPNAVSVANAHGGNTGIYVFRRNGTTVQFYKNGSQIGTDQTLATNAASYLSALFAYPADTINTTGHILEVLAFDSNISDANMTLMWTYLNGLYAVY